MILHRPAHDLARASIPHHRQVQESCPRGGVGNIGYPESIEFADTEVPIDQIRRQNGMSIGHGGAHEAAARDPAQAPRAHQTRHPLAPNMQAVLIGELGMNARDPIAPVRAPMDLVDLRRQRDVLQRPLRQRALIPSIKSAHRTRA